MSSTRLPGKPLKLINGLSMIEHVRRRVSLCEIIKDVIVATCDVEIVREIESNGGKAVMTSNKHKSCIDRVAEAACNLKAEVIINVQGDMPLVNPNSLDGLIKPLLLDSSIQFTDMISSITDLSEINNPNVVKVVTSLSGFAIYYSRKAIPTQIMKPNANNKYFKQLGINAFRKKSLIHFSKLKRSYLEISESIDMLRLLDNDLKIKMVKTEFPSLGVDTPDDLINIQALFRKDKLMSKYHRIVDE